MPVSMDLIKRVVVQGSSEGLDKLEGELRKIAATTDGVSVSFEKASRSQLSAQNAYNRLSASIDPADKAQQQIAKGTSILDKAFQQGVISQDDYQKRIGQLKERYGSAVTANDNFIKGAKATRYELINLSRQLQDVGVGIYSGQSFTTVLIQQGSQIFDVFASAAGGAKDLFYQLISGASKFIFSIKGVVAGIAGIGVAALVSAAQWVSSQNQIKRSLFGVGRASGATPGAINNIANQGASTFGLSVSEARNLATELAATGKIGVSAIGDIVKLGHDVATVLGVDSAEAAKLLAAAFADPAKGAEQLNAKLGFLNARMQQEINDLVAQNRLFEAQQKLADALKASLDGVGSVVGKVGKGWTAVGNTVSNIWTRLGESVAKGLGIADEESAKRIEDIKKEMEASQKLADAYEGAYAGNQALDNIKTLQQELAKLTQEQDKNNESVKRQQANQQSLILKSAINSAAPDIEDLKKLQNAYVLFDNQLKEVNATGGVNSDILDALSISYEKLKKIVDEARGKVEGFKEANARALENVQIQIDAVNAKSPTAKGDIAYRQSLSQSGSTSESSVRLAEANRLLAIKQAVEQITQAQKSRLLSAQQSVETAQTELSVLGKSVEEQELIKGKLQARQQLEQDALQTYGNRDSYDRAHLAALEKEIEKQASIKQALAEQQLLRDVRFETSTLGLSDTEQGIASRLRSIYGDTGWQSQMNGAIASQIRFNEAVKTSQQLGSEFATGFAQDLRNGVSAMDALTNAVKRLSDRLIDMALNQSINALFAKLATGLPGSANGNAFSGGNIIPFARGGIVDRATIFPMARGYGLMGEAGPEAVMPLRRGQDGRLGVVAAGGGGPRMVVNVINNAGSDIQARQQSQPRQNSDGSISLDVVIERAVRNAVNSDVASNGPMTQGLARRFNLNSAAGIA